MPAITKFEEEILGIDEICHRLGCSRSQFFIWRRDPNFPPVAKTKHGLKGYFWPGVLQWLLDNRHRLRCCAGRPNFDELVASLQVSTRDDACNEAANSGARDVPHRGCGACNLRETVSGLPRTPRPRMQ